MLAPTKINKKQVTILYAMKQIMLETDVLYEECDYLI